MTINHPSEDRLPGPTTFHDLDPDEILERVDEMVSLIELSSSPTIDDDAVGPELVLMVTLLVNDQEDEFHDHLATLNPADLRTMLRLTSGTIASIFRYTAAQRGDDVHTLLQELALDIAAQQDEPLT